MDTCIAYAYNVILQLFCIVSSDDLAGDQYLLIL